MSDNSSIKAVSSKDVFKMIFESEKVFRAHDDKCIEVKEHSENVCKICKDIALKLKTGGIEVDKKLLKKAAYLHDIGKAYRNGDAHPFMSVIYMYDIFDCSGEEGKKYAWKLGQIIIAHKGIFCPPVCVAKEAAILRMADKIDKYNKSKYRLKKARKSYEKNLEKIREYFRDNGLDDEFKQIETACEHERKKTKKRQINTT